MQFNTFSPQVLRSAIEFELQKIDNAKIASVTALENLRKDCHYYEQFGLMEKARVTKYVKRTAKPGGGYDYTYAETKEGWISKFANIFGFKDNKQVLQKVRQDYQINEIDKKYNLTWDGWKNHVSEYFLHKDKWDNFFSGKKTKKETIKKEKTEAKKKAEKKVKKEGLKLSVMRELFGLYGGVEERGIEDSFEKHNILSNIKNLIEEEKQTGIEYPKAVAYFNYYEKLMKEKNDKKILALTKELHDFLTTGDKYSLIENKAADKIRENLFDIIYEKRRNIIKGYDTIPIENFLDKIKKQYEKIYEKSFDQILKSDSALDDIWSSLSNLIDLIQDPVMIGVGENTQFDTLRKEINWEIALLYKKAKKNMIYPFDEKNKIQELKNIINEVLKHPAKNNFDTMPEEEIEKEPFEMTQKEFIKKWIELGTNLIPPKNREKTEKRLTIEAIEIHKEHLRNAVKNGEIIPENVSKDYETPSQKKEDVKIAKEINKASPETRNRVEREIMEIPEPATVEIVTPELKFSLADTDITIPFYKGGTAEIVKAKDYTNILPKDIYLVNDKNILTDKRPEYIPEIDEDFFKYSNNFVTVFKIDKNKYILKTNRERRLRVGDAWIDTDKVSYAVVNRDILAATQDYYFKKARALQKKKHAKLEEKYGVKGKVKRISMLPINKISREQMSFMQNFTGRSEPDWKAYGEIRQDLKQKSEDMEIQLEEYYNTHTKGRETAYGDKGLNDSLFDDYGVKVKRQNGEKINDVEIKEIQSALNDVYSVFGNRTSMSKNFDLKISHSGDVLMHARNAAGLFMPSMKAIGITAKHGEPGTGFILAHEFSHFMDYYMGEKENRHYSSDNPVSIAGEIASTFRRNMVKRQKSAYQNRTCECFARAMEQYYAIKTNNKEIMDQWDTGNHPMNDVFERRVMPLIDKFFLENDELLKAVFFKKFNTNSHQFEYKRT